MNTMPKCSKCHKPLPTEAPDGLCPACLMKAGLGTGKRWLAIAGGSLALVAFLVGVLLWPSGILSRPNLSPGADAALLAQSEALRLPGNGPAEAGFLPVREVAFGRRDLLQDCFLSLENGRLFSAPESLVRQLAEQDRWHPGERLQALAVLNWLRTNRVDLMARTGRDGLTLVDGFAVLAESRAPGVSAFETIEADHVLRTSTMLADTLAAYTNQQPQGLSIFWFDPRGATKTWIFRTRTGRAGALEILEDGRESGPMKARYKLVED